MDSLTPSDESTLVNQLEKAVDHNVFFDMLESIIKSSANPSILARCAELASRREPGGPYYRAKIWAYAEESRSLLDGGVPRKTLGLLSVEAGVNSQAAKAFISQGRAILDAESENLASMLSGHAYVEMLALREAPAAVFQNAVINKGRATDYLTAAADQLNENPRTTAVQIHNKWCLGNGSIKSNLDIIKPSDWWAFSHPKWRKEEDFPGSIPGEVYANSLYYFAPQSGIAVDAMGGSGMLKRVYDDRERWQKDTNFELEVRLFDLHPRRSFIEEHDARKPLPFKADWIFVDPPYYGQSDHLFQGDLASTDDYYIYLSELRKVIEAMADSLNSNGRFCLFLPKWSGRFPEDANYDAPSDCCDIAKDCAFTWIDTAYVSRARQQEGGSAIKNVMAKRERRMRSDTCVLNVFEKR